jgi:hypothetical protein
VIQYLIRMAFNPITLDYDKSLQGEILKNRDIQAKDRAFKRAENLDKHFNAAYNLLTGEDRIIMQKIKENNMFMIC